MKNALINVVFVAAMIAAGGAWAYSCHRHYKRGMADNEQWWLKSNERQIAEWRRGHEVRDVEERAVRAYKIYLAGVWAETNKRLETMGVTNHPHLWQTIMMDQLNGVAL